MVRVNHVEIAACHLRQMEKSGKSWTGEGRALNTLALPTPPLPPTGRPRCGRGGGGLCKPHPWNRLSTSPWRSPNSSVWLGRASPDPPACPSQLGPGLSPSLGLGGWAQSHRSLGLRLARPATALSPAVRAAVM